MILVLHSTSEMKIEGYMFVSQNFMGFFRFLWHLKTKLFIKIDVQHILFLMTKQHAKNISTR